MKDPGRQVQYYGPGLVAIIAAGLLLVAGPSIVASLSRARTQLRVQLAHKELADTDVLTGLNDAVQNIARAVEPSVVHITVSREGGYMFPLSTGSGWVFDDQGHIVTNHHVVEKNGEIEVQFSDGARVRATRVGSDELTDVAVIRVLDHAVVPAARATGEVVRQGDLVFAFGSPFGFQFSMSTGIVSGLGRFAGLAFAEAGYQNYIQTDAAINPGNSGGPLTNVRGEVIGMNFAIAVSSDRTSRRSGGQYINSGVGLAIPLDIVEFVAGQIIEKGQVERGGLGIELRDLSREWQNVLDYHAAGVRIDWVKPDSPAEAAGLLASDVIFSVDDQPVHNRESFRAVAHAKEPGEQIILGVWRKKQGQPGQRLEVAVILGKWDDEEQDTAQLAEPSPMRFSVDIEELGLTVIALDGERLARLGFEDLNAGVYVQSVRVGSLGDDLGFRAGMVIVSIDSRPVSAINELTMLLRQSDIRTTGVNVEVIDGSGDRHTLHLRIP